MRMRPAVILLLILLILLLIGAGFAWTMQRQMVQLKTEEAAAVQAAEEQIVAAAEAVPRVSSEAQDAAERYAAKRLAAEHVYAHRGSSGASLEHSFRQYDAAIEAGARYLEQDIVISKEGTLYVSHDLTLYRLTGTNKAFAEMTDAQIDQLRTHAGEKVLRLSEVFDHYGTTIHYVIELKSADPATLNAFTALVDQYDFSRQVIVQCFSLGALQSLEEVYPDMPKLYLVQYPQFLEQGYQAPYVDIISVDLSMMTKENVKRAHKLGKQLGAWTMLTEDQIRRAIDLGVDNYFTDNVEMAIALEEDYGFQKRYRK